MPDVYMNLTDAEAAELGYDIDQQERHDPLNEPPQEVVFGLLFFLMACLFAAGLWSALHPSDSASVLPRAGTTPPAVATLAVNSQTAPQAASEAQLSGDQPQPAQQAFQAPRQQYLPDGWNPGIAVGPIHLFHGERVVAIIPAGTEFLCSWGTVHDWSYVVTVDGESSGWARLRPRVVPRRTLLQPKFERALIRLRQMQEEPLYRTLVVYHSEAPGSDLNGAARETINRSTAVESATRACNEGQVERQLSELIQAIANFDGEGRDHAVVKPQH